MNSIKNKTIYYVSNLGTNTISIIDGATWGLIKEIEVGQRPYEIEIDNKKNIYVASDRNDNVIFINNEHKNNKIFNMPNNGHIKVDFELNRIYVSNTEELCVYRLDDGEIIKKIVGFTAIGAIELSKDSSKIFILDIIENEIKIYDTIYFKLIKTYKEIFFCSKYILISNNDRYLYIVGKNIESGNYIYSIAKVDLNNEKYNGDKKKKDSSDWECSDIIMKVGLNNVENSKIKFPIGSIITYLIEGQDYLYAVNKGLSRIDVIDDIKNNITKSLKTTLEYPQRIKLCINKNYLLATSIDENGKGALDLINIKSGEIERTLNFSKGYPAPYDIEISGDENCKDIGIMRNSLNIVALENIMFNIENEEKLYKKLDIKLEDNIGSFILAKKIISTYKEKMIFKKEKIQLISEYGVEIKEINFDKCVIMEESKSYIRDKRNYIVFKFKFSIPYYINYTTAENENLVLTGKLNGKQKAILYIPDNYSLEELEFQVKSLSRLVSTPYIKENVVICQVISIISTYIITDKVIFTPCRNINSYKKGEEEC